MGYYAGITGNRFEILNFRVLGLEHTDGGDLIGGYLNPYAKVIDVNGIKYSIGFQCEDI